MKQRRTLALLALIILLGAWWTMRQSASAEPSEGVIDVWVTWGEDPYILQELLDPFSEISGVPVLVESRIRSQELEQALASNRPPDLVVLSNSALIASLDEQGLLRPLDGWIAAKGIDLADIYPAALAPCRSSDGSIACLPWGADVYALYWNKDLFAAAGLDPDRPPATLEELATRAEQLTLQGDDGELRQIGFLPDLTRSHTELYLRLFASSWDGDGVAANEAFSTALSDALAWERGFYKSDGPADIPDFAASLNRYLRSHHPILAGTRASCRQCHPTTLMSRGPDHGFWAGEVAMMIDGQWGVTDLQPDFELGVAPVPPPAAHPERAHTGVIEGPVVLITAGAVDAASAADLLAWMVSPDVQADAMLALDKVPTSRVAACDPRYKATTEWNVFADLLAHPNATPLLSIPFSAELNEALRQGEEAVLRAEADPRALLEEIEAQFGPRLQDGRAWQARP